MISGAVVDPSPLSRPLLQSVFVDCEVRWSTTGEEGLNQATVAVLRDQPVNFILLDAHIHDPAPELFIEEFRALEQRFAIERPAAIIMMSSSSRVTVQADHVMPELAGFLCRPFQRDDLERCFVQAGLRKCPV
jgi:CheY-like chemotaxis protein